MTAGPDLAARRERLREAAAQRGLDGVLVYSWRRGAVPWLTGYAPGFATNTASLWLPASGSPRLGVRFGHELRRAADVSGLDVVAAAAPAGMVPGDAHRVGVVGGDFAIDELPSDLENELRSRDVETVRLDALLDEWRAAKDEAEIARLAHAAAVCDRALRALPARLAGLRDYEVAGIVEGEARRSGSTRALCLVGVGAAACITEPHGQIVPDGEPVGLELTLQADLACGHVCHTVPGRDGGGRAQQVCAGARRAIVGALRPGVPVEDVVAAGDRVLADAGLLQHKEYDFGHGLGVDTPEQPRLVTGTGRRVEAGMVLAVHVSVRAPHATWAGGGPVAVRADGTHELAPDAVWMAAGQSLDFGHQPSVDCHSINRLSGEDG